MYASKYPFQYVRTHVKITILSPYIIITWSTFVKSKRLFCSPPFAGIFPVRCRFTTYHIFQGLSRESIPWNLPRKSYEKPVIAFPRNFLKHNQFLPYRCGSLGLRLGLGCRAVSFLFYDPNFTKNNTPDFTILFHIVLALILSFHPW